LICCLSASPPAAIEQNVSAEQWYTLAEFAVLALVLIIQTYVMQNWFGGEAEVPASADDWA
jgi:hypothetical protein